METTLATHFIKELCSNFFSRIPEAERPRERERYEQIDGGKGGQKPSEWVDSVLITASTRLVNV